MTMWQALGATRDPVVRTCFVVLALLLFGASEATGQLGAEATGEGSVAIVGGMLLDGYEVPPIHDAVVLLEGNRIVAVGSSAEISVPSDARVIDARGKTILPGLIDLHVHLMILGHGEYTEWFPIFDTRMQEVMEISAKQLLMAGVTTGVDMGAPLEILEIRDRIEDGSIPGPRLLVSGPWITRSPYRGLPDHFQYNVESPDEAAARARELIAAGVDVIKTWSGVTEADVRAVAEVAQVNDVPIHSHVYSPGSIRAAMNGGASVLQHAGSAGNTPYDDALVTEIAQRGIPVVQTMAHRIWIYPATIAFPTRLQDPRLEEDLPDDLYRDLLTSFQDFHRLSYFHTTPRQIRNSQISARQFIEADAVNAMGTDSGTPLNFHTEAAAWEILALVESGMTPLQAISASTMVGARVIGRRNDLGTIEPGKLADIIVVDGNPLRDINVLRHVVHVIKDGVQYK